jgi:hypothetical protein
MQRPSRNPVRLRAAGPRKHNQAELQRQILPAPLQWLQRLDWPEVLELENVELWWDRRLHRGLQWPGRNEKGMKLIKITGQQRISSAFHPSTTAAYLDSRGF